MGYHANYVWNYTFRIHTSYFEIYEEDEDTISPEYITKTFEVEISKQLPDKSYDEKTINVSYWDVWTIWSDGRLTIEYPVLTKELMLSLIKKVYWEERIQCKPNLFVSIWNKSLQYYLQSNIFDEDISISFEPKEFTITSSEELAWLSTHWFRTI